MYLIYADFMKCDTKGRLGLSTLGTKRDLDAQGVVLEKGLSIVFYNHDEDENGFEDNLIVEGVIDFDETNREWVAIINWKAIKNYSELSAEEKTRFQLA